MPETATMVLFAGTAALLLAVPGPAVVYIVARSSHEGIRAGLVSVLGMHTGTLVHVMAAAFGLSAIVAASATAFTFVKLAGAVYLVYLGVTAIVRARRGHCAAAEELAAPSGGRIFLDAISVSVLNPKTAVFFLAIVPQFVSPQQGGQALQILVLGSIFVLLGLITDSGYALLAGSIGKRLVRTPAVVRLREGITGAIFVALGATIALADSPAPGRR